MASLLLQAPDIRRANDKVHDKIDQDQDLNSCTFVVAAPHAFVSFDVVVVGAVRS